MLNTVLCSLCLDQASDLGSSERRCWAECGTASYALLDQSAESREGSNHRWHLSSRNLPGQLQRGPEGRSGTAFNLYHAFPFMTQTWNYSITHLYWDWRLSFLSLCICSLCVSWWRQRRWRDSLRWSSPPTWEMGRPTWSRLGGLVVWSTTLWWSAGPETGNSPSTTSNLETLLVSHEFLVK